MAKTTTPLPQLIPQRIKKCLHRLEAQVWERRASLQVEVSALAERALKIDEVGNLKFEAIRPGAFFAREGWGQVWFRCKVPPAAASERGKRFLMWNANGETTVYIDGTPWAGLDTAHLTCPLPDRACTLHLDCGTYQTGIWEGLIPPPSSHGLQFNEAAIGIRSEKVFKLYHDVEVLWELVERLRASIGHKTPKGGFGYIAPLEAAPPLLRQLLHRLDDAIDFFDLGRLDEFEGALRSIYDEYRAEAWGMKAGYVGHSHVDLVWLWPEEITYRKGIHTFSTILRLMERYPDFVFSMSQPALIKKVREQEPRMGADIEKRIREGRWEATGALLVECDDTIASGESLVRCLLHGQKEFQKLNGKPAKTVWLPDVFGYSACLPQILSQAGIENFYTTKMLWSNVTRFPHNSFIWKGPDGSEVLAHLAVAGYNSLVTVQEAVDGVSEYRQADVSDEVLIAAGYGDGGGGPTEGHCERAQRLKSLASVPAVRWTTVEGYFKRLAKIKDKLPSYTGELYLEYHRGTYTTQQRFKQVFRRSERALQMREAVGVAMADGPLHGSDWERLIFSMFHDAIPGSSIGRVYSELSSSLEALCKKESANASSVLESRRRSSDVISVFNSLPFERETVFEVGVGSAKKKTFALVDDSGKVVPLQAPAAKESSGKFIGSVKLGALESRTFRLTRWEGERQHQIEASPNTLSNEWIAATFNDDAALESLSIGGRPLRLSASCGFTLAEDNPAEFDAWDIDHPGTWLESSVSGFSKLRVIEAGPIRATLESEAALGSKSRIKLRYSLAKSSSSLEVSVFIDWKESHKLLRYKIPTGYKARTALYGCPFGSVERPHSAGTQSDEAKWEVPGSRWMALTDRAGKGIALVTEASYGFRAKEGVLNLSLVRSPKHPDPEADMGSHVIRFALGAYNAFSTSESLSTAAAAESLYCDFLRTNCDFAVLPAFEFTELDGVVPSWVLSSERDPSAYLIRLHEAAQCEALVKMRFWKTPKKVALVDLLENELRKLTPAKNGHVQFEVVPSGLVTLKVWR